MNLLEAKEKLRRAGYSLHKLNEYGGIRPCGGGSSISHIRSCGSASDDYDSGDYIRSCGGSSGLIRRSWKALDTKKDKAIINGGIKTAEEIAELGRSYGFDDNSMPEKRIASFEYKGYEIRFDTQDGYVSGMQLFNGRRGIRADDEAEFNEIKAEMGKSPAAKKVIDFIEQVITAYSYGA